MIRTKRYTMVSVDILCNQLSVNRSTLDSWCKKIKRPLWRLNTVDGEFWELRSTVTLVNDVGTDQHGRIIRAVAQPIVKSRTLTSRQKNQVAAQQHWQCMRCKTMLSAMFEIDHITDFACAHDDSRSNLQALCSECHRSKTFDSEMYGDIDFGIESRNNLKRDEQNRENMFSKYFQQNFADENS